MPLQPASSTPRFLRYFLPRLPALPARARPSADSLGNAGRRTHGVPPFLFFGSAVRTSPLRPAPDAACAASGANCREVHRLFWGSAGLPSKHMPKVSADLSALETIIAPVCRAHGVELVCLQYAPE